MGSNIPFQLSLSLKLIFHVLWIFGKRLSPLYGPHPTLNQLMGHILSPRDVDMPLAWMKNRKVQNPPPAVFIIQTHLPCCMDFWQKPMPVIDLTYTTQINGKPT